jgi:AmmeMemoRadiSam system protein B/AmmeMemoRadiSam system protein A
MKRILACLYLPLVAVLSNASGISEENRSAMERNVRNPAVAGQFYTADPRALKREIEQYLDETDTEPVTGDVVAIVSPHAGYMYSGRVAAHGYGLVRGRRIETVVVIAPSHVEYFDFCSVFDGDAYRTPLGDIPIDREISAAIASKHDLVRLSSRGHAFKAFGRGEHSLEVQLPFLQVALGEFELVAIVMGDQDYDHVLALGEALGEALGGTNSLIVASTDLSHFHPDKQAKKLDGAFMEALKSFDPGRLHRSLSGKGAEACGGGPTAAAMIAAKRLGAVSCEVLDYATSGDITGDTGSVVGYVSAVMTRSAAEDSGRSSSGESERTPEAPARPDPESGLSKQDKIYLLKLARKTIADRLGVPIAELPDYTSPVMKELRGGFVTLKKNNRLRGCIGYIEAVKPLEETIEEMAIAAAFNDYRFPHVEKVEFDALEIEISVLSPIEEITDPTRIEVGVHGIIISRGMNRGLLLPQVATEWNWNRETFLSQTCVKAGLKESAWTEKGTKIEVFSADVFNEEQLDLK